MFASNYKRHLDRALLLQSCHRILKLLSVYGAFGIVELAASVSIRNEFFGDDSLTLGSLLTVGILKLASVPAYLLEADCALAQAAGRAPIDLVAERSG
jgi:hypothetical protein